jgi:hypothetical protein
MRYTHHTLEYARLSDHELSVIRKRPTRCVPATVIIACIWF